MARKSSRLTVLVTRAAQRDLDEIWEYNAERYSPDHADDYGTFLERKTQDLTTRYREGRAVPGRPEYQFLTFRKGRGHCHVAIYRLNLDAVEVLRYQHTAQDWQGKAKTGEI